MRVAVVRVAVLPTPGMVLEVAVLGLALAVVLLAGFRTLGVVPVTLPGLDVRVLVLRVEVDETVDFFSSSLALTLGRLRCVAVVDGTVRRTAVVGGRVGGLLRPPVARAVVVVPVADLVADGVAAVAVRRVAAAPVAAAGRLTAEGTVLASPLARAAASGEVFGSELIGVDTEGEAGAASGCTEGVFSLSDMAIGNASIRSAWREQNSVVWGICNLRY